MRHFIKLMSITLIIWLATASIVSAASGKEITIVTFNTWFGLDGVGTIKMGEYEDKKMAEKRYQILLKELKRLDPDIIGLQEANKLPKYAKRIARDLGYDEIHQINNSGIKIGPLGIPYNMKMGLIILAKKPYHLKRVGAFQISGDKHGIYKDWFTFHLSESWFVLSGKIEVDGKPIYLFNTHLHAGLPENPGYFQELKLLKDEGKITPKEYQEYLESYNGDIQRFISETKKTLCFVSKITPSDAPAILMGDFNATENSDAIKIIVKDGNFLDTYRIANPTDRGFTWCSENPHTHFDAAPTYARGNQKNPYDLIKARYDLVSRRIDYIFINSYFQKDNILDSSIILNKHVQGLYPSDHYGVLSRITFH